MAGANSTIVVRVVGSTKGLSRSLKKASGDISRLGSRVRALGAEFKAVALVAAIFSAVVIAGAAAAAAALIGLPALIAGIGIAFAATNERVKSAFGGLKTYVVGVMKQISEPLVGPLVRGAGLLRQAFDNLVPSLRRIFIAAAPLVDGFFAALPALAARLGPALERIFAVGAPVLAAFGRGIVTLGEGFGRFFAVLGANVGPLTGFIDGLMGGLAALLPALAGLFSAFAPLATVLTGSIIPAFSQMISVLSEWLAPVIQTVSGFLQQHAAIVAAIIPVVLALVAAFKAFAILSSVAAAFAALNNPIGWTVLAIAALAAAFVAAYRNSAGFRSLVNQIGGVITGTLLPALRTFGAFLRDEILPIIVQTGRQIWANLQPVFTQLATTFREDIAPAIAQVAAKFREWWPTIQKVIVLVAKLIGKALVFNSVVLSKVLPPLIRFAGFIISKVVPVLIVVIGTMIRASVALYRFGAALVAGAAACFRFAARVRSAIGQAISFIASLPGRAASALGGAASALVSAGASLISGFISGIKSKIGEVRSTLSGLTSMLPSWKGPAKRDRVLLVPAGRLIMRGLVKGIKDGTDGVRRVLGRVTDFIKKALDKKYDGKALKRHTRALMKSLGDEFKALKRNAKLQDKIAAKTKKARDALRDLRKKANDYAKGIQDSIVSYGSITNLGEGNGFGSLSDMLAGMRARVTEARKYTTMVKQLRKLGLNKTTLQQLLDAGVEGGLGTAQTLLSGGKAAIDQINQMTRQLGATGKDLGTRMREEFYRTGLNSARDLVAGLRSQQQRLDQWAQRIGERIRRTIRRALGGKNRLYFENLGPGQRLRLAGFDHRKPPPKTPPRGGGARIYNINVKAPATVNQAGLGREIVKAIEAYERAGGRKKR